MLIINFLEHNFFSYFKQVGFQVPLFYNKPFVLEQAKVQKCQFQFSECCHCYPEVYISKAIASINTEQFSTHMLMKDFW